MSDKLYELLNAISSEGIIYGDWGVARDVKDTSRYFGTKSSTSLEGGWLYIYFSGDLIKSSSYGFPNPDRTMPLKDGDNLYLYKLN